MTITFRFENRNALGRPTVQRTFISLIVAATIMLGSTLAEAASICGMKFDDKNNNGIFDGDDKGIDGWTINLVGAIPGRTVDIPVRRSTKTAATPTTSGAVGVGHYCFLNLAPGTYIVFESPQNVVSVPALEALLIPTTPVLRTVVIGSNSMDVVVDFGNTSICNTPVLLPGCQ